MPSVPMVAQEISNEMLLWPLVCNYNFEWTDQSIKASTCLEEIRIDRPLITNSRWHVPTLCPVRIICQSQLAPVDHPLIISHLLYISFSYSSHYQKDAFSYNSRSRFSYHSMTASFWLICRFSLLIAIIEY